jgi:hypothetical protein
MDGSIIVWDTEYAQVRIKNIYQKKVCRFNLESPVYCHSLPSLPHAHVQCAGIFLFFYFISGFGFFYSSL